MSDLTITVELKAPRELMDLLTAFFEKLGSAPGSRDAEPTAERSAPPLSRPVAACSSPGAAPAASIPKASPQGSAAPPRAGFHIGAETPPAADARTAAGTSNGWPTEARKEILREFYPTDLPPVAVMAKLRASPGPDLPDWSRICTYAIQTLKLRRAVRHPGAQSAFARSLNGESPITADLHTIRVRAAAWGLQVESAHDLPAVNEHAKRIGHRPFVLEHRSIIANRGAE